MASSPGLALGTAGFPVAFPSGPFPLGAQAGPIHARAITPIDARRERFKGELPDKDTAEVEHRGGTHG